MNLHGLVITSRFLSIISELDEFKGAWRSLATHAPERLLGLKHVATIASIGSSTRIDSGEISDVHIDILLDDLPGRSAVTQNEKLVVNYASVLKRIYSNWQEIDPGEEQIKLMHSELGNDSCGNQNDRGRYKLSDNHVELIDRSGTSAGIIFHTAKVQDTSGLMQELLECTSEALQKRDYHPLIVIAACVITFVKIHPFQDGNGRLSRLLTTLLLLRSGYEYLPYSSLESIMEQYQELYYLTVRRAVKTSGNNQTSGRWWTLFFLHALLEHKRRLESRLDEITAMQKSLPELSLQILECVQAHGRTTLSDAVAVTQGNRNTVKRHLQKLVASHYLLKQGTGKATWYVQG